MSPRLLPLAVLAVAGVFIAGLFVPGVLGGLLLLVTVGILISLSYQTRDRLHERGLVVRVVIVVIVAALAVAKFAGHA